MITPAGGEVISFSEGLHHRFCGLYTELFVFVLSELVDDGVQLKLARLCQTQPVRLALRAVKVFHDSFKLANPLQRGFVTRFLVLDGSLQALAELVVKKPDIAVNKFTRQRGFEFGGAVLRS